MSARKKVLFALCLAILLSGCGSSTGSGSDTPSEEVSSSANVEPSETASAPEPSDSPAEEPSAPASEEPSDSVSEEPGTSTDSPAGEESPGNDTEDETTPPETAGTEEVVELGEYATVMLSGFLSEDTAEFVFDDLDLGDYPYRTVAEGSTCTIALSDACKCAMIELTAHTLEDGTYVLSNDEDAPRHKLYADGRAMDKDIMTGSVDISQWPLAAPGHTAYFTFGENLDVGFGDNSASFMLKADGTVYRLVILLLDESAGIADAAVLLFSVK